MRSEKSGIITTPMCQSGGKAHLKPFFILGTPFEKRVFLGFFYFLYIIIIRNTKIHPRTPFYRGVVISPEKSELILT